MDSMSLTMAVAVVVFGLVYGLRKLKYFAAVWAWMPDDVKVLVPGVVSAAVLGFEAFYSGRPIKEAVQVALSAMALAVMVHHGAKLAPFIPYGNKPASK